MHPVRRLLRLARDLGNLFKIIANFVRQSQDTRVILRHAIVTDQPLAPGSGQLRHRVPHLLLPVVADNQRHQVRLRKVAVVVGVLLRSHRRGRARVDVIEPRLLPDLATCRNHAHLPRNLVLDRLFQEAEGVQILHFRSRAELLHPSGPYGDIGITAQMALLHIAGRHPYVLHGQLQFIQISDGFLGAANVGLTDDFSQRDTGAVQVHIAVTIAVAIPVVGVFSRVVLEMQTRDTDALCSCLERRVQPAVLGQRLIELRNLVALRQIRIEVILAGEP